jgi:hypothetical protein
MMSTDLSIWEDLDQLKQLIDKQNKRMIIGN